MISPRDFEIAYQRNERKLYLFLSRHHTGFIIFAGLLLELILWIVYRSSFGNYRTFGSFLTIQIIRNAMLTVVPLSFICFLSPVKYRRVIQFLCLLAIWFTTAHTFFEQVDPLWLRLLCYLSIPLICSAGWIFMKWRLLHPEKKWWLGALIFSLFYLFIAGLISLSVTDGWHGAIRVFWNSKTQFYWLTILIWSYGRTLKEEDLDVAIHPINALRGAFWPKDLKWNGQDLAQKKELWWWGFGSLLLGSLILLAKMALDQSTLTFPSSIISRGASTYLLDRLSDVGIFNLLVGSIRLFGYRVQDATNFVFLSRTPADSWRRVSVYNYLFVLKYVYTPLLRFTRNAFILTFVSFFVYFLNHQTTLHLRAIMTLLGHGSVPPQEMHNFYGTIFGFLSSFFLIYFSRKNWLITWKKMEAPLYAWLSVLSTHVVFILARILGILALRGF